MVANNLPCRGFTTKKSKEKIVSDTTVIISKEDKLYITKISDLFARLPVGIVKGQHNNKELVKDSLQGIILRGCDAERCIIHSCRRRTYESKEYREIFSEYRLLYSKNREEDCWNNALMENF